MPRKVRRSINNQNKLICIQCQTPVLENEDAMECDLCKKTLHTLCTKLNKVQIEELMDDKTRSFNCHFCVPLSDNYTQFETILKEMKEMKETIKFMSSQYDDILRGVKRNTQNIKNLQKENKNLKEDVRKLKSTVTFLNDIRVKNNCIINGIKTKGESNAIDVVLDIAKKSGAELNVDKIEDAYFIGKKSETNKSLTIKFVNTKSKIAFMKEKKKLREFDEMKKVFINDFLSRESLEVLKHAKTLKTVGFKYIYTYAGQIFAKKSDGSRQIRIKSMEDIDNLLFKFAGGVSKRTYARDDNNEDDDYADYDDADGDNETGACFLSSN